MDCMRDGFIQGKLLGDRFLTVSPLNHGSFGMVFAAKDTVTGADVAIKCITKPGASQNGSCPAAIAVDERSEELAIHSKLPSHPNIVNLVHHFDTEHHQYMVLELCNYGDLYEAIRLGNGPKETGHVRDFMLQLVSAVQHLHSNCVFHRDIKPENIFLASDRSMKLGDFGLATTDTWSTEFAVGSDRYMAPEQYDASVYGYGYSTASADVWAIGIVLLNILFQRNPFATPTPKDPLFADFARDRQSLFDVFPNMSQDTYNVLVHSLALDPANRSLTAVREALLKVKSFTTDDETLDDFCTAEAPEVVPVATAAREPLRTPSITSPTIGTDSFPWANTTLKTSQKTPRQLSTIPDEEVFAASSYESSEWQYVDTDEASLSSNVDSGLGMSYKSSKSAKSSATKPFSNFVGSLPISFSRSGKLKSPYGAGTTGFSKSWSDLWDEDEELMRQGQDGAASIDLDRVTNVKPSTPHLESIREDDRGSVTPRQGIARLELFDMDESIRTATASPLRQLVEADRKLSQGQSPKQRSNSIIDKWAALGNFRRAKVDDNSASTIAAAVSPPTSTPPKTRYSDKFANFTPFASSKKQKSHGRTRERDTQWRHGSPARLRSTSVNNSRVWERKEPSPTSDAWSRDNNWREHMLSPDQLKAASPSPPPTVTHYHTITSKREEKGFLDTDFDEFYDRDAGDNTSDIEWVGGWKDFTI